MAGCNDKLVLVMAGGTGGHVFPALAVAEELIAEGCSVVWMGTRHGMEANIIQQRKIPIEWVRVAGLRGKGLVNWLKAPMRLIVASFDAMKIIRKLRPCLVLGMGGFVSGPGGLMARFLGRPLIIHEQNAISGLTNRLLSRIANEVFESFPDSFSGRINAHLSGNPVRASIRALYKEQKEPVENRKSRLLVVGGSLGAHAINTLLPKVVAQLPGDLRPEIWHQTGKQDYKAVLDEYEKAGVQAKVAPFIDEMEAAYRWADLAVCRAGAMTVSELSIAGVPSILIPFPYAVDDHQTRNAQYLVDAGAALLFQQEGLNEAIMTATIEALLREPLKLKSMSEAARKAARPEATREVAECCMRYVGS